MSFRVPDSSSPPPSTPERPRNSRLGDHPSTTPAGPPPSSLTGFSTTPAGNPPASSFFGADSNGSAVPFPSFQSSHRKPPASSPLRVPEPDILEDDEDEPEAMDEDGLPGQDNMDYTLASRDDAFPRMDSLDLQKSAIGLATRIPDSLPEPDSMIIQTERILDQLARDLESDTVDYQTLLSSATASLLDSWRQAYPFDGISGGLGPKDQSSGPAKALFVASLLLPVHHPPLRGHAFKGPGFSKQQFAHIPNVLLSWLDSYHYPFRSDLEEVFNFQPNPTSHQRFWDVVFNSSLRGDMKDSCELLRRADFAHAVTALEDGSDDFGYTGKQLATANRVAQRAVIVLESCPALQNGDWNVRGQDWSIFRRKVEQTMSDLEQYAEGNTNDRYSDSDPNLEASHFGMTTSTSNSSINQRSRQAESNVPWSIYQNLMYLYGQLLGTQTEILASAGDWVEAVFGLAAWWDGEDQHSAAKSMVSTRRMGKSLMRQDRLVDTQPETAYVRKLADALLAVNHNPDNDMDLTIDPTSEMEVALGCALGCELDGLVRLLKGWSPVIANAVTEIASYGGWLGHGDGSEDIIGRFNQSDLMVLSYAQQKTPASDHAMMLSEYAELLAKRQRLADGNIHREGWQAAISVLGRLHADQVARKKIGELLDQLDFKDPAQVTDTVRLCQRIGLDDQARHIAERFGDKLVESSELYGAAIFHYSRAGAVRKIKELLDVLTSLSLVQSMAFPPADELDDSFRALIQTPKQTVARLGTLDPDDSATLLRHISGYATIRRFYELRDQEHLTRPTQSSSLRPLARKKEALANLVGLIQSASDCIHGGLYDNTVDTAIPVDGLLVLLGEALPFVNHPKALMDHSQTVMILKAVEDLSTVSSTIYEPAEETFKQAIASYHGSIPPTPRETLKKSVSNLSGSQFSLIGSEMLKSQEKSSASSSGVLVKGAVQRGWDWRKGFQKNSKGEDVLKILRLGLSKEMSRTWLRGSQ